MPWFLVDCRATVTGWTGKLDDAQLGRWVRVLSAVKTFGERGVIKTTEAADCARVSVESITELVGLSGGAWFLADDLLVVRDWKQYQRDPTHAERQSEYRERRKVTKVTSRPSRDGSDGCDADNTGHDSTGHDTTPPISPAGGVVASLSGDLEQVFDNSNKPPAMSVIEQSAQRLAVVYRNHTVKKQLQGRAAQCFREALESGMDAHDLEQAIITAGKLAPPWEIVDSCRTDKATARASPSSGKSFREQEDAALKAERDAAIDAAVERAKAKGVVPV